MGLSDPAVAALQLEGITLVDHLGNFKDEIWTTVVNNLKHPATIVIQGPNQGDLDTVKQGVIIHIGALSLSRLKIASCAVR